MCQIFPLRIRLNCGERLVGKWLHPPGPPSRKKNNLLSGASAYYPTFDCIQSVRTAMACLRNLGEFYGRPWICVSSAAPSKQHLRVDSAAVVAHQHAQVARCIFELDFDVTRVSVSECI